MSHPVDSSIKAMGQPGPMSEILRATSNKREFVIIVSNEYEIGENIPIDLPGAIPKGTYLVLRKDHYPLGGASQWRYKVSLLPENPMTEEDMEDIST